MSKITKKELRQRCIDNETAIARLESILKENGIERQPQLKQLDQSVFNGLDEKWRFAAVNAAGRLMYSKTRMVHDKKYWWASSKSSDLSSGTDGYDASNWQNSLIERESRELTGSELCKAMLERGDRYVMCFVSGMSDAKADSIPKAITSFNSLTRQFRANHDIWRYAVPINNQGEPLTAAEVGL